MPAGGPADWLPAYEWAADRFGAATVERLLRAYGSRIEAIIGTQDNPADPGEQIAPGLFEAELHYLRNVEFAHSAEDVLWRRSKLGLHLPADAPAKIADWFAQTRT